MPDVWGFVPLLSCDETLDWQTGVSSGEAEARLSLRSARQSFSYRFSFNDRQMSMVEGAFRAGSLDDWLLPIWPDAVSLEVSVAASDAVLPLSLTWGFRAGGLGLAHLSDDQFVIFSVDSVASDHLVLAAPIGVSLVPSSDTVISVVPLELAIFPAGLQVEREFPGHTLVSVDFKLRGQLSDGVSAYPQHLGIDVLSDASLVSDVLAGAMSRPHVLHDNLMGPMVLGGLRVRPDIRHDVSLYCRGADGIRHCRDWLLSLRGRDRAFWLPMWADSLELVGAISSASNSMTVRPVFSDLAAYVGRSVLIDDGAHLHREITSAVQSGANHRLFMSPLGRAVGTAQVSLMNRVRMAADQVTIRHTEEGGARIKFPVVEIE